MWNRRLQWVSNCVRPLVGSAKLASRGASRWHRLPVELNHPHLPCTKDAPNAVFTNIQSLVEVLRDRIDPLEPGHVHTPDHIEEIRDLLSKVDLNEKEWLPYANFVRSRYTRSLVAYDPKFIALLLCWERGQRSPIHDHAGASCWVKMLSGELEEVRYERTEAGELVQVESSHFSATTRDVSYMNDTRGVHQIINPSSDEVAVSLHIYAPAFSECQIFQPITGEPKTVSMVASNAPVRDEQDTFRAGELHQTGDQAPSFASSSTSNLGLLDFVDSLSQLKCMFSPTIEWAGGACASGSGADATMLLEDALQRVVLTEEEWSMYCSPAHFSEFKYTRNLVHLDECFSVMVLCWGPGQKTPAHSHGMGRQSWFKVVRGELELDTLCGAGGEGDWSTQRITSESAVTFEDSDLGMHRLGNVSTELPAISIHVYSPPLKELDYLNDDGNESRHPVVCYGLDHGRAHPETDAARKATAVERTAKVSAGGGLPNIPEVFDQCFMRGSVFTNFQSFCRLVDYEFQRNDGVLDEVLEAKLTHMLKTMAFNPKEWESHAKWDSEHFTRVLLHESPHFSLMLNCWDKNQFSPAHDHGTSKNWMKILQGSLEELQFEAPMPSMTQLQVARAGTMSEDSVTFIGPNAIHSCVNLSDEPCFAIHLYSPPYSRANFYDQESSARIPIEFEPSSPAAADGATNPRHEG